LRLSVYDELDFVPKEKVILAFSSSLNISIGVAVGIIVFSLELTGLITGLIGIGPDMSGVDGGILTLDYLQDNGMSKTVMENLVENTIANTVTKIGKVAMRRSLQEIKTTEKT
jgi:hypothetical protein